VKTLHTIIAVYWPVPVFMVLCIWLVIDATN
jgi:hypothetical protein